MITEQFIKDFPYKSRIYSNDNSTKLEDQYRETFFGRTKEDLYDHNLDLVRGLLSHSNKVCNVQQYVNIILLNQIDIACDTNLIGKFSLGLYSANNVKEYTIVIENTTEDDLASYNKHPTYKNHEHCDTMISIRSLYYYKYDKIVMICQEYSNTYKKDVNSLIYSALHIKLKPKYVDKVRQLTNNKQNMTIGKELFDLNESYYDVVVYVLFY